MKQHLLKNSFLRGVLFLLLCVVGLGNAWGEEYKLITSTSELVAGEKYIIASMADGSGFVMTNYESGGNNWTAVAATTTSSTITFQNGMATLTLGGTDGKWTFNNGTYYMTATSTTSKNYLKGVDKLDDYSYFTISFSNNAAVITCTGKDSRNILRKNSQSKLFACYSSGQLPVYLYKKIDEPEQTKTVTSLSISETPSNITYYVGEEPSAEGLKVTATYSDNTTNIVTSSVSWSYTPATITSGTEYFTATASYEGKEATSEPFSITVKSIANTEDSAYTVAKAYELINNNRGLSEEVYVKGIISRVDEFNEKYGSITYWISEDGTTEGQQFQCYSGKGLEGADFSSIDDLQMGCEVVVKGKLNKFNDNYQFNYNNEIVSIDKSNAKTLSSIEISGTPTKTTYDVGETPSADGLTVTAIYVDASSNESEMDVTEDVEWTFSPETIEEGTTQVTATATYGGMENSFSFDVKVNIAYFYTLDLTTKTYYEAEKSHVYWNANVAELATYRKNSGTTAANNYLGGDSNNRTSSRFYTDNTVTLTPKANVTQFVFYTTSDSYAKALLASTYTNALATRETGSNNIVITPTTSGSQISITMEGACGCTAMKVYYQPQTSTLTNAGYATFCLPYSAIVPDGLTAYTATDAGEYIKLSAMESGKIAANEGVVLKGEPGEYTFVATPEAVTATEGNQMVGVTEETALSAKDNAYMLTSDNNHENVAFRLLATDYTLAANKAYLKVNETEARTLISVMWDDNATGIENTIGESHVQNGAIYNLAGQKLMRTQKGINIINGKLVIK